MEVVLVMKFTFFISQHQFQVFFILQLPSIFHCATSVPNTLSFILEPPFPSIFHFETSKYFSFWNFCSIYVSFCIVCFKYFFYFTTSIPNVLILKLLFPVFFILKLVPNIFHFATSISSILILNILFPVFFILKLLFQIFFVCHFRVFWFWTFCSKHFSFWNFCSKYSSFLRFHSKCFDLEPSLPSIFHFETSVPSIFHFATSAASAFRPNEYWASYAQIRAETHVGPEAVLLLLSGIYRNSINTIYDKSAHGFSSS